MDKFRISDMKPSQLLPWQIETVVSTSLLSQSLFSTTSSLSQPTLNFSNTSRGPTTKCYSFLDASHGAWLFSNSNNVCDSIYHPTPTQRWWTEIFLDLKFDLPYFTSKRTFTIYLVKVFSGFKILCSLCL